MPKNERIIVDWKYHSEDPLSMKVVVFGKSEIEEEGNFSEVFSRIFLDFYRREISFYDQGKAISRFLTPMGCDWKVDREDISPSKYFSVSEARLINPLIGDKKRDIFYVSGDEHLSEISLLNGEIIDITPSLLEDFIFFYSHLLERKEKLLSSGNSKLIDYIDLLRRFDRKDIIFEERKEEMQTRRDLIELLL